MRSAYSGAQGYHAQGVPFDTGNSGYDQGADRLSNIRRTIDSIEQRLMGAAAPVAGYGQPAMPAVYPQMPMQPAPQFQPPYGQAPYGQAPAGQAMAGHAMGMPAAGPGYYPQPSPANLTDNFSAEIARRQ